MARVTGYHLGEELNRNYIPLLEKSYPKLFKDLMEHPEAKRQMFAKLWFLYKEKTKYCMKISRILDIARIPEVTMTEKEKSHVRICEYCRDKLVKLALTEKEA